MKQIKIQTLDSFLREETKDGHMAAEEAMIPLGIMAEQNSENYRLFLTLHYHWHKAVEEVIASVRTSAYAYKSKLPYILEDLGAMHALPSPRSLPGLKSDMLPGIIYTVEGSMLGGTMINRHLAKQGMEEKYRNYLSYCAHEAPKIWPEVKNYLRSQPEDEGFFAECAATSKECFQLMVDYAEVILSEKG